MLAPAIRFGEAWPELDRKAVVRVEQATQYLVSFTVACQFGKIVVTKHAAVIVMPKTDNVDQTAVLPNGLYKT